MNLFGINVNSLITPEVKFIVSKMRFVSSLGEDFPALVSFDQNQQVVRELIVVKKPILKGHQILPGYKHLVESREDGRLSSLADDKKVLMGIKARKSKFGITTSLVFIGLKGELDKVLLVHDVPVVASNRKELIEGVKEFMKELTGIEIEDVPCTIRGVKGEKIKVEKVDVDYATLLL
ncbi:MAG: hypothetical protein TQ35_0007830 [Candidatus Aramenus sulfurataquae]|jgi:hypothetical protein|uniref:Uncharacterized protein n=2 Tax=Candidatus Aramenus sulfurataquae TaxID=1326980 RepID=A0AAE3FK52_9CREN|nr:hypothetical protein [Candidatus Aramenus sulfurataquae]